MATVYLALGSNLGNRAANMRMALDTMTRFARIEAVSSLYETDPEPPGQPPYYNAAAKVEAGFEPLALIRFLQGIEAEVGRRPTPERNAPRSLDIDILLYDDMTIEADGLIEMHPVRGETIGELSIAMGDAGVRKIAEPGWQTMPGRKAGGILGRGPAV
jgi:2-amino-4-hydroxy-6-hydroxymethyldihydropteridine diphosphokinase